MYSWCAPQLSSRFLIFSYSSRRRSLECNIETAISIGTTPIKPLMYLARFKSYVFVAESCFIGHLVRTHLNWRYFRHFSMLFSVNSDSSSRANYYWKQRSKLGHSYIVGESFYCVGETGANHFLSKNPKIPNSNRTCKPHIKSVFIFMFPQHQNFCLTDHFHLCTTSWLPQPSEKNIWLRDLGDVLAWERKSAKVGRYSVVLANDGFCRFVFTALALFLQCNITIHIINDISSSGHSLRSKAAAFSQSLDLIGLTESRFFYQSCRKPLHEYLSGYA